MTSWLEPEEIEAPQELKAAVGGHPLVARMLRRRGIDNPQTARAFLNPRAYTPASPLELPGMEAAVGRLQRAIAQGESICVWGDFDVDGQTATTLLVSVLRRLGAKVSYHIPVRATESHGINLPALKEILDGGVQLVLTCDTGINAHREVEYAHDRDVDTVITDHHDLPLSPEGGSLALPPAVAVINPKLLAGGHPLATLPGVGAAYKLAEALCAHSGCPGEVEEHLDLAALGIVADIALLRGDARYLVQRGLEALRLARRPGLQAMLEYAELQPGGLTEEHIGYELAPRLNALGRLGDANPAVELLTTQDRGRARVLALELEGLNARRKLLTGQVFQGALAQIEQDPALLDAAALVLAHPAWPAGVIGIVAGQLAERYRRPVLLLSTPPGELGRGSARSVEGVNIHAAIAAQGDLLAGFGGHPMAAGLSIQAERIPELRRRLSREVEKMLGGTVRETTLQIDGHVPLGELTSELVADLERLAPFGAGNPQPVLASRNLRLSRADPLGRNGEHVLLMVEDEAGTTHRIVWWQGAGWPLPEGVFDLAYTARASSYRGGREIQIEWVDARQQVGEQVELVPQRPPIEVVDYRSEAHPLPLLRRLQAEEELQVWREADAREKLEGRDRYELIPSPVLAIWTTPPGPAELSQALEMTDPRKVYLFGNDPPDGQPETFLQRLAGLLKHVLRAHQGRVGVAALAAATGQREATVRTGLDWLEANGNIHRRGEQGGEIVLAAGDSLSSETLPELTAHLQVLLEETAAYRAYFNRADKERLLNPQPILK